MTSTYPVRSLYTFFGRLCACGLVRKMCGKYRTVADLKQLVADRIANGPKAQAWTPLDFLDLGSRDAVDKALQRLVHSGHLRRLDRAL